MSLSAAKPNKEIRQEVLDFYEDELDVFRTYLEDLGYSVFSINAYISDVQHLLLFLNTTNDYLDINVISKKNINDFLRRTQKNKEKTTRNRRLMAIRTFFKVLIKSDILNSNPASDIDTAKIENNPIPTYLTDDELGDLFNSIKRDQYYLRNKCILMLMGLAGLRVIEIYNLNLTDVIRNIDDPGIYVLGKGNKKRYIPLPIPLYELMIEYEKYARPLVKNVEHSDAFFTSKKGNRLCRRRIQKIAEETFLSLKTLPHRHYLTLKPLSSHKLRHSFGSRLVKEGVNLVTIQELMGHKNLNTTQIYTHIDNKSKQEAMRESTNLPSFF